MAEAAGPARAERQRARRPARVGLLALPLALCALLWGCGADETSSFELRPGGRPVTEEEIQRAVQALFAPVEPVPYPEPGLPEPPPGFARLAALLDEAEIETAYEAPVLQDRELLQGSVRFSEAGEVAGGKLNPCRPEKRAAWLLFQLGGVPAEEIAEIVVRGSFGPAERFAIGWGEKGAFDNLGVDVQESGSGAEYVIPTDGLVNFEGKINLLRVGVPCSGSERDNDVELESVRLRDRRAAHREAVGLARRRLEREVRGAVFAHGATTLRFPTLAVDGELSLSFGVAVLDQPIRLRLSVAHEGEPEVIFDEELDNTKAWRDHSLRVAARGSEMRLIAEFEGPPEAVAFVANPTLYRPQADPPRILLYLIDTMSADHLSLHGYSRHTSPHLERLAEEGGWFANGLANSSWTGESIPHLLTSTHTRSNGISSLFSRLEEDFVTLPEVLAAAGYATAAFSTNANAGPERGTDQGFDSFFDHIAHVSEKGELRTVPVLEVVDWLEKRRDRPTFLYVHTAEPHFPYSPPPPYDKLFDPDYDGPVDGLTRPSRRERQTGAFSERDREHLVALYDGETAFADHMFGELRERLETSGLLERTLIVVTSDHGEAFGERDKFGHGVYLYPELLRVPIVFGGGGLPAIGRVDLPAQLLDLMPTLVELAGLEASLPYQGESLAPVMRGRDGGPSADRPMLFAVHSRVGPRLALSRGKWKLGLDLPREGVPEVSLFDTEADSGEDNDLVDEYPEGVRVMLRELVAYYKALPRYGSGQARRYEISQEQVDRLRALGYIE